MYIYIYIYIYIHRGRGETARELAAENGSSWACIEMYVSLEDCVVL